jgi:lysophospholipase L1-like esterase
MAVRHWFLAAYLLGLHAALGLLVLRPDLAARLRDRIWPNPEVEVASAFRQGTAAMQRTIGFTARPGAVWFFGDSIIHAMDTARITPRALNLGIGEDTVAGVWQRVTEHPTLPTAAGVVIAVGTNDVQYRTPEAAGQFYAALLARLPPALPVVASAVLPVDETARPQLVGRNAAIQRLNALIARACTLHPACLFADAGPRLTDAAGNLAREHHRGDGLHLSPRGYHHLIETLAAAVQARMPADG